MPVRSSPRRRRASGRAARTSGRTTAWRCPRRAAGERRAIRFRWAGPGRSPPGRAGRRSGRPKMRGRPGARQRLCVAVIHETRIELDRDLPPRRHRRTSNADGRRVPRTGRARARWGCRRRNGSRPRVPGSAARRFRPRASRSGDSGPAGPTRRSAPYCRRNRKQIRRQ